MKVILTGSTGYIGGSVLQQCLKNESITSIIAIGRRDPGISNPKLQFIQHSDFTSFPSTLQSQFHDAEACIYCLGTNVPISPADLNRKVNFDYALSTAWMLAKLSSTKRPFRFVYLSGALPVKDANKRVFFVAENRKMRGMLENALVELDREERANGFVVHVARPGFVQPQGAVWRTRIVGVLARIFIAGDAIMKEDLGRAMVRLAIEGYDSVLVENEVLIRLGSEGGS